MFSSLKALLNGIDIIPRKKISQNILTFELSKVSKNISILCAALKVSDHRFHNRSYSSRLDIIFSHKISQKTPPTPWDQT